MLSRFQSMGKKKPYMIFALTDETYSVFCGVDAPADVNADWFYFFIALLDQVYWVLGCTLGALGASIIQFNSAGIDFVMTALFIVIMIEQWEKTRNHLPVLIGIITSILSILVFGADKFIIPAMIGIILLLSLFRRPIEQRNLNEHA